MSRKRKSILKQPKDEFDLEFEFTGCKFNVSFEPDSVPEELQDEIRNTVELMSKTIYIDKSYVKCKDNKHDDVFLTLEGWNSLMTLLSETCYGDEATDGQFETLVELYYSMALGYMYSIMMSLYPEYISHILIEPSIKSDMAVDILKDNAHEWRTYPGKWQTWKENN